MQVVLIHKLMAYRASEDTFFLLPTEQIKFAFYLSGSCSIPAFGSGKQSPIENRKILCFKIEQSLEAPVAERERRPWNK